MGIRGICGLFYTLHASSDGGKRILVFASLRHEAYSAGFKSQYALRIDKCVRKKFVRKKFVQGSMTSAYLT